MRSDRKTAGDSLRRIAVHLRKRGDPPKAPEHGLAARADDYARRSRRR